MKSNVNCHVDVRALFRSVPRATLLVGCQGSHGHLFEYRWMFR